MIAANRNSYPISFLVGIAMACAIAISILYLSMGGRAEEARWVYESLVHKRAAVQRLNPELIIVSGSNGLFGFSAKTLSSQLDVSTVNLSVHAGLGVAYMLDICRQYLGPGRIFILPLEYEQFDGGMEKGSLLYSYLTRFDPGYYKRLRWTDKIGFVEHMNLIAQLKYLLARYTPQPSGKIAYPYQWQTQNEYGDETNNTLSSRTEQHLKGVLRMKSSKFSHSAKVWKAIETFAIAARAKGSDVVFAYPNIFEGSLDIKANHAFFEELNNRARTLNITIIGKPDAYTFGRDYIFDSNYHQNSHGQAAATDRLIADLRASGIVKP